MGLRCTLLGHAYGEPVTERDREQRGDEEVVTTRKLRTCRRCGAETVLSENTEVRHLGSESGASDSESPATEPRSEPEPAPDSTEGEPQPGTEPATETGDPADSEPDVADLVESAEAETPSQTPQETEASDPETTAESYPETADGSEPESAVTPANESPESEPETTDTEADEGIILDETSDRDPTPETAGIEDSDEYSALSASDTSASAPDQSNETDGLDDSEDLSASAAESTGPSGPATDTHETEPTDATASTEEPDSMFGEGTGQSDTTTGASAGETDADSESDPWKERPPTAEREESAEAESEWDDPTFQFGLQEEASDSGAESAEQGTRGPAGIKSEGPLDVDSEPDLRFKSLECPECGFSESAQTSLRAGDICPECHRGYLAGRR